MADSSDPPTTMKITVKTPKEQHTIEIPSNATVQEVFIISFYDIFKND
jgi:hypothetical protein